MLFLCSLCSRRQRRGIEMPSNISKEYYVYILTNRRQGILYIGVTSDLVKRVDGFTQKYNVDKLVYFEHYIDPENAILRENRMKKWKRKWKTRLIEENNPEWRDLYGELV
jgi:putative endonuclease